MNTFMKKIIQLKKTGLSHDEARKEAARQEPEAVLERLGHYAEENLRLGGELKQSDNQVHCLIDLVITLASGEEPEDWQIEGCKSGLVNDALKKGGK